MSGLRRLEHWWCMLKNLRTLYFHLFPLERYHLGIRETPHLALITDLPIPSYLSQAFTCLLAFSHLYPLILMAVLLCHSHIPAAPTHLGPLSTESPLLSSGSWLCAALVNRVYWYPVGNLTLTSTCTTQTCSPFALLHDGATSAPMGHVYCLLLLVVYLCPHTDLPCTHSTLSCLPMLSPLPILGYLCSLRGKHISTLIFRW